MQAPVASHDPEKPLPEDGLKMLSNWPDLEKLLTDLTDITELLASPQSLNFLTDKGNSAERIDFGYGNNDVLRCKLRKEVGLPSLVNSSLKNNDDINIGDEQDPRVQQFSVRQLQMSSATETKVFAIVYVHVF